MSSLRDVGVVIVTYASAATVEGTLAALPTDRLGAVVVVDNSSPDDTVAVVRGLGATVVEQPNLGFGAGNNRGERELPDDLDLVLFLNPDAVLQTADLERMVEHLAAHERCAVVGPRVLSGGRPTYSAGRLPTLASELRPLLPDPLSRVGPRRRLPVDYAVSGPVGYVEGACFLVRRAPFQDVGGFDEGYFLYAEELELAQRLRRRGWQVHLCAGAVVEHAMGVSTAGTQHGGSPHLVTSMVRYLRRWHGERAARTWVRVARASWVLRSRTGRLGRQEAQALRAAAAQALSHPPPPPAAA